MERILVIDIECTCWKNDYERPGGSVQETIEIGGSLLELSPAREWELTDAFSILVRPTQSAVGEFCQDLTGISQKSLDDFGWTFPAALEVLKDVNADVWASWGNFDYNQLRQDSERHGLKLYKYLPSLHLNVKALFSGWYQVGGKGLGKALAYLNMEFDGTPHRGEDDSKNVAIILKDILNSNKE